MNLPTGTVTFLLTDIEGSTRLWEEQPDAMRLAVARHDEFAGSFVRQFAGVLVKSRGEGDSLFAVFPLATDAIAAACELQRAFAGEPWPGSLSLKVRMALHTGEAGLRDGDYYGAPVNRCARLRAVAHGGQVLLSDVTHDLCRDTLPAGCNLKSLGEHRLKDLGRSETVSQLCHPDLPADFPPLRSLGSLPNNLPQQLTSFIGREKELGEIVTLFEKTRLLTLTGSGGCGKTRMGLQAAADMVDRFRDGVWLAELAPVTDSARVPQTVASALGLKEEPGKPLMETLAGWLSTKCLLLVVDNCEHLVDACAKLLDTLLRHCQHVSILATSREGLGITGELTYRVPSLSLPDRKHDATPESLSQYEAVRLFIERAQLHQPQFAVTSRNAPALASVCYHLDGIPLAIELAAARVRAMAVEQIEQRLDQRFRLLTGGSRTALPRHQTLRSLVDWSYDLLNEAEQALMSRLSVFAGGCTLEAAEAVCKGDPVESSEALDLLTSLCDKSLVVYEEQAEQARYRMLETVRQYARERLEQSNQADQVRARHRDFHLAYAEQTAPKLVQPEQAEWLERLAREHENMRAALEWSLGENCGLASLRLCCALERYWFTRGYPAEGRDWCERALRGATADDRTMERAMTLNAAGSLAYTQGDYSAARTYSETGLAIFREIGDRRGIAASLNNLGNVANSQGDYAHARAYLEESLSVLREIGDRRTIGITRNNLGIVAYYQGDYASARSCYEESLPLLREAGDRSRIGLSCVTLGLLAISQGDYNSAREYLEESLATSQEIGDRRCTGYSLTGLGCMAYSQGDYTCAQAYLEESLAIQREIGDRNGIGYSLIYLGNVAQSLGDYTSALAHHEESLATSREIGDRRCVGYSLIYLGNLAHAQGDYVSARAHLEEGLTNLRDIGDRSGIAESLESFARLSAGAQQTENTARLLGAAEALRSEIGAPLPPDERAAYDRDSAAVRDVLGDAAFSRACAQGRELTMEQAIELALRP